MKFPLDLKLVKTFSHCSKNNRDVQRKITFFERIIGDGGKL